MASLTGATAVYQLSVVGLFPSAIQLQGFSVDDVFSTAAIDSAEVMMGVDGFMSAGFKYVEIKQTISLQADSDSCSIFDQWWTAQQVAQDLYYANATVNLKALGTQWTMTRGALTSYAPLPDVKKIIQPRKFEITWNTVSPANV